MPRECDIISCKRLGVEEWKSLGGFVRERRVLDCAQTHYLDKTFFIPF